MSTAEMAATGPDLGQMAANGMNVRMLQSALSRSESNIRTIPQMIRNIDIQGAWRCFVFPEDPETVYRWSGADFRRFLTSPRPAGCETSIDDVRKMLAGTDVEYRFEELLRGEVGNPKHQEQPRTDDGSFMRRNCDNITHTPPETIPFPVSPPPTGTSTSYSLRRLKREGKDDLLQQVYAGEITPHAAMVKAGLRKPHLQVKDDPAALAAYLLRKWDRERISVLLAKLADALTD